MKEHKPVIIRTLLIVALLFCPAAAHAWPLDTDWNPVTRSLSGVTDIESDAPGQAAKDIVTSNSSYPAGYIFNDGTFLYYRIRLDTDPVNNQGDGLIPAGWGFLIDTDNDFSDYEWQLMVDGIANPETIYIAQNSVQSTPGDPSDTAELTAWTEAWQLNINFRSVVADSMTNGNADYFLDFRIPYSTFKSATGLTDTSPVRYFLGSTNNSRRLTGDLVDISNICSTTILQCMPENASDTVTLLGTYPSTGSVMFVSGLDGGGDVAAIYTGQTVFIKVTDQDMNTVSSAAQTVPVTVTTQTGDSENVSLTETGPDTGIFTGSIPTAAGSPAAGNGVLQVSAIETATVSYTDAIDASFNTGQNRTDSLTVQKAADLAVVKTADKTTPGEGDTVIYTITVTNSGPNNAAGIQVTDLLPAGVTWVSDTGAGTYNRTTGIWTVSPLINGASASLNITVTVNSGTQNTTITNTASITASAIHDPESGNDSASRAITVGGADLALTLGVDNASPPSGGSATFTVIVTNNGAEDATNVAVTDLLPAGLAYAAYSATQGSYNSGTGIWNVGNLANGESAALSLDAGVTASVGTIVVTTASITASDQADPDVVNNSDSETIQVSGVDLSITKAVSNTAPNENDTITYTVSLTNNGLYQAGSITVSDMLPAGLTFQSSAPTAGAYDNGTGVWSIASLASGATGTLVITAAVNAGTNGSVITNTAVITGADRGDPDSSNNTAGVSLTVRRADLAVTKTASDPSPDKNEQFTYTVTLTNNGPDPAANITLRDTLNTTDLTYNSSSATTGTITYADPVLTWNIAGPVASGANATLTITATVKNNTADGTVIHNLAEIISAAEADPVNTNNTAIATVVTGVGTTDLSIVKSVDDNAPVEGGTVTFTVIVSNPTVTAATSVMVNDLLPAGLAYSGSAVTQGSFNSGSGNWTVGTLGGGASAALTMTATVNAGTTGQTIVNTARITALTQLDVDLSDNVSSVSIVVGATDLAIAKTIDDSAPNEGSVITYTVTIANNGPNNATNVLVADILPAGLTYGSSVPAGAYNSGTGVWTAGALATGAVTTLNISATVQSGTAGTLITNTAAIASADQADTDNANNSANVSVTVQKADVYITKTAGNAAPQQGMPVVYTITVGNSGPSNATGVTVFDLLPAGVTYVSDDGAGAYNSATGTWDAGSVAKDTEKELNITVMVNTGGVTITNTANIASADQTDPAAANNTASAAITPVSMPSVVVVKSVSAYSDPFNNATDPKAIPGAIMQYTIVVTNTGPGTAQNVFVTEAVPGQTELFVDDIGAVGSGPVLFAEGASGLTYMFGGFADMSDSIAFSKDGPGGPWDFVPSSAGGFDKDVTHIKISPSGTFSGATPGTDPSFNLTFRVRVK